MFTKKFLLTAFTCLILMTNLASTKGIFKDAEGFSYIINPSYLIFTAGNSLCGVYDLSSIHILADNKSRFEFNVLNLSVRLSDETVLTKTITNVREDYSTGNIYVDGKLLQYDELNYITVRKTQKEIYYKMKSAALSR